MKKPLDTDQKKEWAQLLYTSHNMEPKEIAHKIEESEATIRNWIQEGQWEGMRRSLLTAKEVQLQLLYEILGNLTNRIKEQDEGNTKDADLLIKYTAAIKNLEAETSISQIIEVAKLFIGWLQQDDRELAKNVTLKFDHFIKERLKKN